MSLIYCVEDDESIRELVGYALKGQGYLIKGFADGVALEKAMEENVPDLILLDIMLPGESGLSLLKKIRGTKCVELTPVIIMTAKSSEFDIVKGLDLGADDYVTKPFGIMELLSRVRSVLRRSGKKREEEKPKEISFHGIRMDLERHLVWVNDKDKELTLKEFDLLHYLLLNKEIVLTREQIMQTVWGIPLEMESRTIDVHIKSLRKKLGDVGKYIHTVRGVGYKLGTPKE